MQGVNVKGRRPLMAPAPAVSRRMGAQSRRDTKPEIAIRRRLHAQGLRYRVDFRLDPRVRSRADIVFTRQRLAIFVDGCFWHRCPLHGTLPRANAEWWMVKLEANVERDARVTATLLAAGWRVLRIWEHEPPEEAVSRIKQALQESEGEL
jgi:DNA mismatch endonuclease (patch repair protein)